MEKEEELIIETLTEKLNWDFDTIVPSDEEVMFFNSELEIDVTEVKDELTSLSLTLALYDNFLSINFVINPDKNNFSLIEKGIDNINRTVSLGHFLDLSQNNELRIVLRYNIPLHNIDLNSIYLEGVIKRLLVQSIENFNELFEKI